MYYVPDGGGGRCRRPPGLSDEQWAAYKRRKLLFAIGAFLVTAGVVAVTLLNR